MVWKNIFCHIEPEFGHLCQDCTLLCNDILLNDIKTTDTVCCYHEAAIGKIAGEQLIKLMTLGLTEAEAEEQIINGFLK